MTRCLINIYNTIVSWGIDIFKINCVLLLGYCKFDINISILLRCLKDSDSLQPF